MQELYAHSPLLHRRREEDYLTGLTESARGLDSLLGQNGYALSISLSLFLSFIRAMEEDPGPPPGVIAQPVLGCYVCPPLIVSRMGYTVEPKLTYLGYPSTARFRPLSQPAWGKG